MDFPFMTAWLDDLLDPKSFNDFCVNGLCVEANDKVTRIVTGVSLRDQLIDAAIDNGFYDSSHFDKCFEKIVGISPSEYQRKIRDI